MKKIAAIILVGLLGFLGCGGSDDGTSTVGVAIPVAPFGITDTATPTYEWTPVPWATKYRLLVQDTNETPIIEEWYTAEEAGCESEDGLCMATPSTWVLSKYEFKVQACANEECGLWSEPLKFDSSPTPLVYKPRFTDYGDGTVLDSNTSIMWTKNASATEPTIWEAAKAHCDGLGLCPPGLLWRLPTLSELLSLHTRHKQDPDDPDSPHLPRGHPFTEDMISQTFIYWTSSEFLPLTGYAPTWVYTVDFSTNSCYIDGPCKATRKWAPTHNRRPESWSMYAVWCVCGPVTEMGW